MINKSYTVEVIAQVKKVLESDGVVQLQEFFDSNYFISLSKKIKNIKLERVYTPQLRSYEYCNLEDKELNDQIKNVMSYMAANNKLKLESSKLFCFKHKDYTLLSDDVNENNGFTVFIGLSNDWDFDFGGYVSFTKDNKEVFRAKSLPNSVTVARTDSEMRSFIKYLNHYVKKNKFYFIELKYA